MCCAHSNNIMEHLEPNQFDSLLSSGKRALVMFYADWCPWVKMEFKNHTIESPDSYFAI